MSKTGQHYNAYIDIYLLDILYTEIIRENSFKKRLFELSAGQIKLCVCQFSNLYHIYGKISYEIWQIRHDGINEHEALFNKLTSLNWLQCMIPLSDISSNHVSKFVWFLSHDENYHSPRVCSQHTHSRSLRKPIQLI